MSLGRCSECGAAATRSPTLVGEERLHDSDVAPGLLHHALLNANDPPQAAEIPFIQSIAAKIRTRLDFLDDEIARLRDRLGELEGERTSLARYHPQITGILSPLRRMPPEILVEIFSWTLPSLREALHRNKFTIQGSPWVLTHVSRRWRAVSISTPELWSLVALDYVDGGTHSLAAVKAQIERPRRLQIHFHGDNENESGPQIEMLRCLIEQASRWEDLSLNLTSDLVPLLAPLQDRISSLRRLWVQWDMESEISTESIDCFRTTTSLLEVGVTCQYHHVAIPFPAHQLTLYHVVAPWETHLGILKLSQKLVTAHIEIFDVADEQTYGEIIELTRLRRLYVSEIRTLNCLKAPALLELAVHLDDDEDHSALNTFIARSAPNLRSFCLEGMPTVDTITEILRKCASVTEFALAMHPGVGDYFSTLLPHLTLPPPTPHLPVSPHLSRISFWCMHGTHFDYVAYLEMLQSRWKAGNGALKTTALLVTAGMHLEPAVLSELEDLRRDGLDILTLEGREASETLRFWAFTPQWI